MDFNAKRCYWTAKRVRDEEKEEKYKELMLAIEHAAKAGEFQISVNSLTSDCCKWLLDLGFNVFLFKPGIDRNKTMGWHCVSKVYYDSELALYGSEGAIINWNV